MPTTPDPHLPSTPPFSSPPPPKPTPLPPHSPQPPLLLALSGPTSSGKTSLATALHALYPPPHSQLIHADDFYKRDEEIPFVTIDGGGGGEGRVRDWDCAGALDLEALEGVLRGLKVGDGDGGGEEGGLVRQGNFEGYGEGEGEGEAIKGISQSLISTLRSSTPPSCFQSRTLIILDGFLLFGTNIPASLTCLFDLKILLRTTFAVAKERRERRNGYVTLEGFWEDPEGYFEGVVWPGYEREYGGVLGRVGGEGGVFDEEERVWCSDPGWGLERCLEWVVGVVRGVGERDGDSLAGA